MCTLEKLIAQLCPDGVEYKPLGEVCKCNRTQALTKDQLDPNGAYPVVNSTTGIYGRYKAFNNEGASIIIASHGVNAGNVSFITGKYWAGALCYPYQAKNRMLIDIKSYTSF